MTETAPSKIVIVIDLDGTLIPYDFVLKHHEVLIRSSCALMCKILTSLLNIFRPFICRFYTALMKIIIKVISIKIEGKYLKFHIGRSYYATMLNTTLILCKDALLNLVNMSILDGLKKRREIWKTVLRYHGNAYLKLLVTGNHFTPLIEKICRLANIQYAIHSYGETKGFIVLTYIVNKERIARRLGEEVGAIISDSPEDLRAFSKARQRILIVGDNLKV